MPAGHGHTSCMSLGPIAVVLLSCGLPARVDGKLNVERVPTTAADSSDVRHMDQAGAKVALKLMEKALQHLDEDDVDDDIGAHLDLAIDRLRQWLTK